MPLPHRKPSFRIPENTTTIEDNAFNSNEKLESLEIHGAVSHIGYQAFYNCKHLHTVILSSPDCTIDDTAFDFCNALSCIVIKAESIDQYEKIKATIPRYRHSLIPSFEECSRIIAINDQHPEAKIIPCAIPRNNGTVDLNAYQALLEQTTAPSQSGQGFFSALTSTAIPSLNGESKPSEEFYLPRSTGIDLTVIAGITLASTLAVLLLGGFSPISIVIAPVIGITIALALHACIQSSPAQEDHDVVYSDIHPKAP